MGAQTVVEIYRTQEQRGTFHFKSVVTIIYFADCATLQGMSGTFNRKCWREIEQYLLERGVNHVQYIRRGQVVTIHRNPCQPHQVYQP